MQHPTTQARAFALAELHRDDQRGKMAATDDTSVEARPPARGHRAAAYALLAAGTVFVFLAIAAIWINRQALETDNWTETSSELLEDEEIRTTVAGFLVDSLYTQVDVGGDLRAALPPQAQALADPAAGALRNLVEQAANEALQRPRVQALWEDANRAAHEQLLAVIEGGGEGVSTEGGVVTLDLGALLQDLANRTGLGGRLAGRIEPGSVQIEVLRSDQLDLAQDVANSLRPLALLLTLLALALFGAAIAVSGPRRRQTLRAAGFGFVAAGALALLVRDLAGDAVVDSLGKTEAVRPAIESTWEIGTSLLVVVASASIFYGVAIVLAAWLAGPTRAAVASRRALAPYLREPAYAYGLLFALILLLMWWAPTPAFRRVVPALIVLALLIAGFELLRRQSAREFPEAPMPQLGGALGRGMDRLRSGARTQRESLAPKVRAAGTRKGSDSAPETSDTLTELERLTNLHDRGALTDEEFAAQKRQLLPSG